MTVPVEPWSHLLLTTVTEYRYLCADSCDNCHQHGIAIWT
jgi:hypothetical protein